MPALPRPTFEHCLWLFPLTTLLHNSEEAIWLPSWSARGTPFHPVVGEVEFRFAVAVLSALAFLVTALAVRRGGRWLRVTLGYCGAMLLNVVFPHALASIASRGYTPGVVTALAINLPVDGYLLWRSMHERRIGRGSLALWSLAVAAATVALIPILFWVGRSISG